MADVVGFGFANIDLVTEVEDSFLAAYALPKGLERIMDDLEFGRMRAALNHFDALPGGCVGNTLCGLSALGVSTKFYGKIGNDEFESLYRSSFREYMVDYDVPAADTESPQCIVLITPDGERSFAQTAGSGFHLQIDDVDWDAVAGAQLAYAEIYACAFGGNTDFFEKLCATTRAHGIPLYIKVVDRMYGAQYRGLLNEYARNGSITLIIGNRDNLPVLTGAEAPTLVREAFTAWPCPVLMTAAENGGTFFEKGQAHDFDVEPLANPKNSSGAGDQFVTGFIAGRLDGKSRDECLGLGARLARQILNHHQPRPPLGTRQAIRF